jgi:hypothetical protein
MRSSVSSKPAFRSAAFSSRSTYHPKLKPGAEGPEDHDPTPEEIMPTMEGED